MSEHGLMSTKDVADYFGVSTRTITRWADEGLLHAHVVTVGGQRRYRPEDVEALREQLLEWHAS